MVNPIIDRRARVLAIYSAMNPQTQRTSVLTAVFFTGFAGLVYEVTWHRYLANLVGSQARAAALILAVFLGGLCLGYVIFGRVSRGRSPQSLVRLCGWTEVAIGIWALAFPWIYRTVWSSLGILSPDSEFALLYDFLVCAGLIGFPTILMGGTLPLLTQGLSRDLQDAASFHARVYAVNTGGAFVGCLAAGFLIIPQLGLPNTMLGMAPLNLIAGLLMIYIARRLSNAKLAPSAPKLDASGETFSLSRGCLIAFLAGFYSLALQTVFIRLTGLTMGSSEYAFSMIVAVYILMIAIGAWQLSASNSTPATVFRNQLTVLAGVLVLYFLVSYWPYGLHVIRSGFSGSTIEFYLFHAACFLAVAVFLALPVGAMGRTMPLLFSATRDRLGTLGSSVGKLYAWNTLGCVAGSLLGGYLLLFMVNIDRVYLICAATVAASALMAAVGLQKSSLRVPLLGAASILLLSPFLLPEWDKLYFAVGTFRLQEANHTTYQGREAFYKLFNRGRTLIDYRDGPNTTVAVIESPTLDNGSMSRSLYVNGKSDGSTVGQDLQTTRLLAHLPALFSSATSPNAAVIGYGTGITPRSLELHPQLSEIESIEIAPIVRDFAPYFGSVTQGVWNSPKLQWRIGDAYRVLGASSKSYSLIVSEPSNPWVTGVEKLFSLEFYQIVRKRLGQGGIYAQWFHTYSTSIDTLAIIVRTFKTIFPNIRVFQTPGDLVIFGSLDPVAIADPRKLAGIFATPQIDAELKEIGISSVAALLGTELWIRPEMFRSAPIHTLELPVLAFTAGRDFFNGSRLLYDSLTKSPFQRAIERRAAEESLIVEWLSTSENRYADLRDFAATACLVKLSELSKAWENPSAPCRTALVALAADREIPPGPMEPALPILDFLSGKSSEPLKAENVEFARKALEGFGLWDSPFLKLRADRLRELSAPCFADPECAVFAAETLAITGRLPDARYTLQSIKLEGAPEAIHLNAEKISALIERLQSSRQGRNSAGA